MKFAHRLGYYLIGLLIGSMILFFVFKNKRTEFCYMPNCRVLKNLRSKALVISPQAQQKLDEKWITMEDIKQCTENGDVDFDRSKESFKGGTVYIITGENAKNEPIEVEMVNFENKALLKDVKKL